MELASGSKRLDLCSAEMAHMLHLADEPPLAGKVCLEVGAGWIPTDALVCHLLGAERVIATDIEAAARPAQIKVAIDRSIPYVIRDVLAAFTPHPELRARLERLLAVRRWDLDALRELGIEYVAPVDLARAPLGESVDFVYSLSVLEHVPVDDIAPLLASLTESLTPGGMMMHAIHLEDHRDVENAPFPFLAENGADYGPIEQTRHGNRVRRSTWGRYFDEVEELDWRFVYEWSRLDRPLPEVVDPAVAHEGLEDLRTSHIGVVAVKRG